MKLAILASLLVVATVSNAQFQCSLKADIVFVLDGSDSVINREWVVFKESVITMLSGYPLDQNTGVTVGCVVFASQVDDTIPIRPYLTSFELTTRIRKLKASRTGTGTSKGIYRMRQLFNTQGRQGVARIGIIIVDGNARDTTQAAREAQLAKDEGTLLLVVGVGNDFEDKSEIRRLASRPDLAYEALDFFALRDISGFLSQRFCEEIRIEVKAKQPTTTTTTTTTTTPAPTTTTPIPTTTTTTTPRPTTTTTTTTPRPITTTTTTTPRPTTTPTTAAPTPQLPPGYDPCDGCRITNGIGYNNHPTDCTMYVQCLFPFGVAVPNYRSCSDGTFWDMDALTCRRPIYVNCPSDPCRLQGFRGYPLGYPYQNNCRTYWGCSGGRTASRLCCLPGERYRDGEGCVLDPICSDPCLEDAAIVTAVATTPLSACRYAVDPTNPAKYLESWGRQTFSRYCAPGTEFAFITCRCESAAHLVAQPSVDKVCSAEVKVTFADGIRDSSGNEFAIGVRNVRAVRVNGTTDGFAGYFDGNSRLLMYRFDNAYFSNQVAIYIRYREDSISSLSSRDEALVANSDCGITPSIRVGFNRGTSQVFGAVNVGTDVLTQVAYRSNEWKDVTYVYDGNSLDLKCSSTSLTKSQTVAVSGTIARKQCALHIGYGQNMAPFVGWIDEIRVYLCIPPQIP